MNKPVIILGGGGHAKVLVDTLLNASVEIKGIIDPNPQLANSLLLGVPVLGNDDIINDFSPEEILLVNGIGSVGMPFRRRELFERFKREGYTFATVIHPSVVIASDVMLGEGTQLMAGVIIQPGCYIGKNTIINTRATIDHDCSIGDYVHIAPAGTLSGGVTVGDSCHIGTAATVIQGISIGAESIVGAGAVVVQDVTGGTTVVGVPAKVVSR